MNCDQMHSLFSDLLEAALSPPLEMTARQHLEGCAACARDYASFAASTRALQSLGVDEASPAYAQALLAGVDRAAAEASAAPSWRLRRVATHTLALLAGAAAVLLFVRPGAGERAVDTTPGTAVVREMTPPPQAIPETLLVSGRGALIRDGVEQLLGDTLPLAAQDGDRLRLEGGGGLTVTTADGRRLEIVAAAPATPRVVETAPLHVHETEPPAPAREAIRRGPLLAIEVDAEALAGLLVRLGHSIEAARTMLRAAAPAAGAVAVHAQPQGRPHDTEETTRESGEPASRPLETLAAGATGAVLLDAQDEADEQNERGVPEAQEHALPALHTPVVLTKSGRQVTLETRGPIYQVIPALIVHLDHEDPVVVDLVLEQLEAIRRQLLADPELAPRLAPLAAAGPFAPTTPPAPTGPTGPAGPTGEDGGPLDRLAGLFTSPSRRLEQASAPSPVESWTTWWERNAVTILEAGTYGTF